VWIATTRIVVVGIIKIGAVVGLIEKKHCWEDFQHRIGSAAVGFEFVKVVLRGMVGFVRMEEAMVFLNL